MLVSFVFSVQRSYVYVSIQCHLSDNNPCDAFEYISGLWHYHGNIGFHFQLAMSHDMLYQVILYFTTTVFAMNNS